MKNVGIFLTNIHLSFWMFLLLLQVFLIILFINYVMNNIRLE